MMPTISVNLAHLQHNLQCIRDHAPQSKVLAMIKANAYGHGLVPVASALHEADALGVARFEEAVQLRQQGVVTALVIMGGVYSVEQWQQAAELNCTVVIHHLEQLEQLKQANPKQTVGVWLKLNTGMNRLGLSVDDFEAVYQQLLALPQVVQPIVVVTHFSEAEVINSELTREQFELLQQCCAAKSVLLSAANSAAIVAAQATQEDWIRPGLMLYGVSPLVNTVGADYQLKPVMSLTTRLVAVNQCQANDCVGYNQTWRCPEAMPVGVAAIGYGDGFPRHIPEQGIDVLVNGGRCQIVGRVSMDLITIDLRACPNASIGDEVIVWGEALPVENFARAAQLSPYELLSHISPRACEVCYEEVS